MDNQLIHQQPNQCENFSSWPPLRSSFGQSFSHALSRTLSQMIARVRLAIRAILLAKTQNRAFVAVFMIAGLAPFSEVIHKFFDQHEGTGYWNAYYFLHAAGPHVSAILCLTGCFLLFPKNNRFKFVLIVPTAYKVAKIIWLAQVNSNEGFHAFVPLGLIIMGFGVSLAWFLLFSWIINLHFHKREGIIARILGILDAPGISDSERLRIARNEKESLKSIN